MHWVYLVKEFLYKGYDKMIMSVIETADHKIFIQWLCNQVTRVIDGGEPVEFKSLFRHWKDCNLSEVQSNLPKISVNPNSKFDAEVLHNHPEMVRLIFKDSLPKNVIINFPLSHKSEWLSEKNEPNQKFLS